MVRKGYMTIYVWRTGHQINETLSMALHAGIPQNILKHTEWADNYFNSTNKHVAVGYGILRGTGDIFHHNEQHGVDYYEVDRGYINPGHFDGYYRISKNGTQARYRDINLPSDRLDKLKFKRENWYNPKGHVLICPPTEYIESFYDLVPGQWLEHAIDLCDRRGYRYIVRNKSSSAPLNSDLKDAQLVMTFNSNVAVDATIKGIPVIASEPSIVEGWRLESTPPTDEEVSKLLRFISYNQFTLEEIRNGTAWRILHDM